VRCRPTRRVNRTRATRAGLASTGQLRRAFPTRPSRGHNQEMGRISNQLAPDRKLSGSTPKFLMTLSGFQSRASPDAPTQAVLTASPRSARRGARQSRRWRPYHTAKATMPKPVCARRRKGNPSSRCIDRCAAGIPLPLPSARDAGRSRLRAVVRRGAVEGDGPCWSAGKGVEWFRSRSPRLSSTTADFWDLPQGWTNGCIGASSGALRLAGNQIG